VLAEPQDPSKPRGSLAALKDKEGAVSADPAWIKRTVEDHFREFQKAPGGRKTGAYLPEEAPPDFPWEAEGAKDSFRLETLAPSRQRAPLHERMQDRVMFRECVRTLSSGKAPGPDEVVNEVIKALPHSVLDVIHDLFTIMWATGVTPSGWKDSNTVLLYKDKGEPDELKNYRPIALANTLYKLWTRVVTCVLNDFAERHHVLSPMQAGFRAKCRTTDQLQLVVMALEDARLSAQDVYALLVDFSQAFNMINHDKLLQVMYALGFPTDAIEVVKDLYTDARTKFMTPHGPTSEVPIDRGTLQGDSLSPFLFLVYVEPLLRWLHVGARGYQFGCLEGKEKVENHLSSVAFADDLTVLCQTVGDLQAQANKVTAYSDWGDMMVNTTKTVATAALHGMAQAQGKMRVRRAGCASAAGKYRQGARGTSEIPGPEQAIHPTGGAAHNVSGLWAPVQGSGDQGAAQDHAHPALVAGTRAEGAHAPHLRAVGHYVRVPCHALHDQPGARPGQDARARHQARPGAARVHVERPGARGQGRVRVRLPLPSGGVHAVQHAGCHEGAER
jgi:hypothetical protein